MPPSGLNLKQHGRGSDFYNSSSKILVMTRRQMMMMMMAHGKSRLRRAHRRQVKFCQAVYPLHHLLHLQYPPRALLMMPHQFPALLLKNLEIHTSRSCPSHRMLGALHSLHHLSLKPNHFHPHQHRRQHQLPTFHLRIRSTGLLNKRQRSR